LESHADCANQRIYAPGGLTGTGIRYVPVQPPSTEDWRAKQHDLETLGWPFLVAVVDEELIGYAYVMSWRSKPVAQHRLHARTQQQSKPRIRSL